jgi:hypothetical protein
MNEKNEKLADTLTVSLYSIYDTVLKQFEPPFSCVESQLDQYMSMLINEPQSRFYGKESDYILNKLAEFSQDDGEIKIKFIERVAILDSYIDKHKRNLQTIIQTLNYLPQGYYKMPEDRKKDIQESIDQAIQKYVENYVIPDLDLKEEKLKLLENNSSLS